MKKLIILCLLLSLFAFFGCSYEPTHEETCYVVFTIPDKYLPKDADSNLVYNKVLIVDYGYYLQESDFPEAPYLFRTIPYAFLGWDKSVGYKIVQDTTINCIVEPITMVDENIFEDTRLENIQHVVFTENIYIGNYDDSWDCGPDGNSGTTLYYIKDSENGNKVVISGNGNIISIKNVTNFLKGIEHTVKTIDISGIDTIKITDTENMFANCNALESVIFNDINFCNVINASGMFSGCTSLKSVDLSCFKYANLEYLDNLFCNCESLQTVNLEKLNTSNVYKMNNMFFGCTSLEILDLTNFNTKNVQDFTSMFQNCSNLKTIYASNEFNINQCKECNGCNMFKGCTNLVGTTSTNTTCSYSTYSYLYDNANYCDITFANIGKGVFWAGYFTAKPEN